MTTGQTHRQTDGRTDAGQSDPYVPLCFADATKRERLDMYAFLICSMHISVSETYFIMLISIFVALEFSAILPLPFLHHLYLCCISFISFLSLFSVLLNFRTLYLQRANTNSIIPPSTATFDCKQNPQNQ